MSTTSNKHFTRPKARVEPPAESDQAPDGWRSSARRAEDAQSALPYRPGSHETRLPFRPKAATLTTQAVSTAVVGRVQVWRRGGRSRPKPAV